MTTLKIATDLTIPADAVTQTFGILAVRGAGKSNLGRVMAEEMFTARLPFVAIDPVGSWRGLRSSSDGKAPGLPIPIFGGRWGDVPLERTSGELLADLVVARRLSCVVDLSEFDSEVAKKAFLLAFAQRLYRKNEQPLHLFLEEADDYIPQRPMRDETHLLRAWENIVRRGRARGLGMTLITQRSAAVNKSVLTQIETLFVLRTTSPQDRAAVEEWVKYNGAKKELIESLPGLANGEAWCWSPHWLGKMVRVTVRRCSTFDSGATPKATAKAAAPATLADVDLPALTAEWSATIERAKAEDPKVLRAEVSRLNAQVKRLVGELDAAKRAPVAAPECVEVPVFSAADRAQLKAIEEQIEAFIRMWGDGLEGLRKNQAALSRLREVIAAKVAAPSTARPTLSTATSSPRTSSFQAPRPAAAGKSNGYAAAAQLAGGEARILSTLVQHGTMTKAKLALIAGYTAGGGGFNNYLSALRTRDLITRGEPIEITAAGEAALPRNLPPLPTGAELARWWLDQSGKLGKAERGILEALLTSGVDMPKAAVAAAAGYEAGGGGFNNAISRLHTFGLVRRVSHGLRAAEELLS